MALDMTYSSRNIGDVFYTLRKDATLNGAVPCNGSEFSASDFDTSDENNNPYSLCVNNKLPNLDYATYNSQVKSNGVCAYFGIDVVNGKFKVPTINSVFIEAGDSTTLAKYLSPGLPNITGKIISYVDPGGGEGSTGCFYSTVYTSTHVQTGGSSSVDYSANFDASRSSAIYGNSTTVQPPAIVLRPMVQIMKTSGDSSSSSSGSSSDASGSITTNPKVPYTFVPGTEAKALEVNANFEYVLKALSSTNAQIEEIPVVHRTGDESITGSKFFEQQVVTRGLEVYPNVGKTGPYIDFHYNSSDADYTSRIYEGTSGYLSLNQNPPSGDSSTKIATTNWTNTAISSKVSSFQSTMESFNKFVRYNKDLGVGTYSLSSILPSDGYQYLVWVHGYIAEKSGAVVSIATDIFSAYCFLKLDGDSGRSSGDENIVCVPVGTGRKVIITSNCGGSQAYHLCGYMKLGK